MLELRLTTYRSATNGEQQTIWQFTPFRDRELPPVYQRDTRADAEGKLRRRPYAEQRVRLITLGPDLISLSGNAKDNFLRFQRAHKWEFSEIVNGKRVWTEWTPDLPTQIEIELLEDIDDLMLAELRFIEKKPRHFNTWY